MNALYNKILNSTKYIGHAYILNGLTTVIKARGEVLLYCYYYVMHAITITTVIMCTIKYITTITTADMLHFFFQVE